VPKVVKKNLLVGLPPCLLHCEKASSSNPPHGNPSAPTTSGGIETTATFMATKLNPMRTAARTKAPCTSRGVPLPLTVLGRSRVFVASASQGADPESGIALDRRWLERLLPALARNVPCSPSPSTLREQGTAGVSHKPTFLI